MRIVIMLILALLSYNSCAGDGRCQGRKVFSCSSLPAKVSSSDLCHSYYTCRDAPSGESCFQCKSSINKFTRGLCTSDYMARCLKKDI